MAGGAVAKSKVRGGGGGRRAVANRGAAQPLAAAGALSSWLLTCQNPHLANVCALAMSELSRQQSRERNAPQHALIRDVLAQLRCACCSHAGATQQPRAAQPKYGCGGAAGVTKRQKTDIALAAAVRSLLPASSSAATTAAAGTAAAASPKGQQAAVARAPPQRQQRNKQPLTPPQQQQRPPQPTATGPRLLEPRQHGAPRAPQQFYAVSAPRLSSSLCSGLIPWCSCCEMPQEVCL